MRIASSGNVGIGTNNPAVALDIAGTNAALHLGGTGTHAMKMTGDASSGRLGQDNAGFFFASDTNGKSVRFLTNDGSLNERMLITSAGNVGIGTQTPGEKLDVVGNARASGNLTVDTDTLFVDATNNRVGVGTITPGQKLTVAGVIEATSGGFKFPDNTTQTTAFLGGGGGTVTSLSQGTGIDLTPDTIITAGTVALSPAALTRNITYLAGCDTCSILVDGDDQRTIYLNLVGAMTINSVTCFSDGGTPSINLQRDDGSAANILTSDLVCESDADGATSTSIAGLEATLALNNKLDFVMVTAGGTAKRVTVTVKATLQ
jgi:hypothetical protein